MSFTKPHRRCFDLLTLFFDGMDINKFMDLTNKKIAEFSLTK